RRVFRTNQASKQLLGVLFRQRLAFDRQRFVARLPKRERLNVFVATRPRILAQIFTPKTAFITKEQGVEILSRLEWSLGRGTDVRPMLDCPIVRQRIHRANIRRTPAS